jgi:LPLT family lysophospholipid transporter-like MFS transporter
MAGAPVLAIGVGFGVVFALAIIALWAWQIAQKRRSA